MASQSFVGVATIKTSEGFVWSVHLAGTGYVATCERRRLTAEGDTWEELRETIDDIEDDLRRQLL